MGLGRRLLNSVVVSEAETAAKVAAVRRLKTTAAAISAAAGQRRHVADRMAVPLRWHGPDYGLIGCVPEMNASLTMAPPPS